MTRDINLTVTSQDTMAKICFDYDRISIIHLITSAYKHVKIYLLIKSPSSPITKTHPIH